jgi:hypothetical protein
MALDRKVPVTLVWVDTMPDYNTMEDGVVYISEKYHTSTHRCLCGCGSKTVLPINERPGRDFGWDLAKHPNGKVSFTPSIGNYPCKAHYHITENVGVFV